MKKKICGVLAVIQAYWKGESGHGLHFDFQPDKIYIMFRTMLGSRSLTFLCSSFIPQDLLEYA